MLAPKSLKEFCQTLAKGDAPCYTPFDMSCPQKTSCRAKKESTNLKFTEQRLVAEIARALQLPSGRTSQGNPSKGTKVSRFSFFSNTTMAGWKITYFIIFSHHTHFIR